MTTSNRGNVRPAIPADERIQLRIDVDIKAALTDIAKRDGRSLSGLIRHLIRQFIDNNRRLT